MPLTVVEQQELEQLDRERAAARMPTSVPAPATGGLTPQEQQELAQLDRERQAVLRPTPAGGQVQITERARGARPPVLPPADTAEGQAITRQFFGGRVPRLAAPTTPPYPPPPTTMAPSTTSVAPAPTPAAAPAAAPASPKRQLVPIRKIAPTISFQPSPAEQASAEAEAAWTTRPAFAKTPDYRAAEVGPIRDLVDRRVRAVRAVLADPSWEALQHREVALRKQFTEIRRRTALAQAGKLAPSAIAQLQHDLGQWQANASVVDQRKEQLRHYVRLSQQLGGEGYHLPEGRYREEQVSQRPGLLASLADRTMLGPVVGAIKGAARFLSGAVSGAEEAEQYRKHEYDRPDLALPPLTGHTPNERRAQITEKNDLQKVIQNVSTSPAGLAPTAVRQQFPGELGPLIAGRNPNAFRRAVEGAYQAAHGKPLSPWQRKLYPTLLRIADVEKEATRKPVAGAAVDVGMLLAGGPLARLGAGLGERLIAGRVLPKVVRAAVPKVAAGIAAGGGAGAPISALHAVAEGRPVPEVLKETGRGFLVGSAIGVLSELGLGALAAGLGKAGERLDVGALRQRAAKSAKAMAKEYGLTSAEVPALRDRIVEALTAPAKRQGGLIHQLTEDLQTRTPENPLVPPSRPVRGRSTQAEKTSVPNEQATVKATVVPNESRIVLLQQIQEAKTELHRLGSFHPLEDPLVANRRVALREQIADLTKRLPPEKAVPTTHRVISGEQGGPSINDVPGTEVTGRTHPGEVLTLMGMADKPDPITGELMVTLRRQDGSITETTPSGYTRGYVKVEETSTTKPPPEHPVMSLQRATPEEVAQRGSLAEDPAERARLQDWAERQARRADQYDFAQRPVPIEAAEDYANAWGTPKNPAYRDYQNLRAAGRRLAGEDPELAQRLTAAADRTRQDWIYAFRDEHFRQSGFSEEFLGGVPHEVPTDRSPWRELTPEERSRLNPAERDALLRQDVTHSLQTLDPDHVPRTEVPKVAKKNLENYADQLHQQAQERLAQLSDEAAARGPAAEAPPSAAETALPITEVPPAVPAAEPMEAPSVPATAPEAAPTTSERYQFMRNREGGQEHGNQLEIRPLDEEAYQKYIRPALKHTRSPDYPTLADWLQKYPDRTHYRVFRQGAKGDWNADYGTGGSAFDVANDPQYLRPAGISTRYAKRVTDFESETAQRWGKTADSDVFTLRSGDSRKGEWIDPLTPDARWVAEQRAAEGATELLPPQRELVAAPPAEARPALPPTTEKPRVSPPVEKKPVEQAVAPLPPAKQEIVQEQAARVEADYRKQGYSSEAAKDEAEATTAKARSETPKARAIQGEAPPPGTPEAGRKGGEARAESATGGGGGVDVPPPAGQGPAAEPPKPPKGMRRGFALAYPQREVGLPSQMRGPKEWQFEGAHEQYFRDNFGDRPEHFLDTIQDFWQTFRSGDYKVRGRVVNAAVSLSRSPFFANVRSKLIKIVGGLSRASDEAIDRMFNAYGKLTSPELGLVNRVAFIRDMWEDVQTQLAEGLTPEQIAANLAQKSRLPVVRTPEVIERLAKVKLPEPWTVEDVYREWKRLEEVAAGNERVTAALDARKAMWDNVIKEYSDAYEAVTGRRPNLSRRDYFRHEVFLYQLGKAGLGRGEGLASRALPQPKRPSFLMPRKGTVLPYQTNLVDADHGVLAQMLYHTQVFKAWQEVMKFDIRPELEKQAAAWRLGHTVADDPTQLSNLFEMQKVVDQLPDAADGQYREFLNTLSHFDAFTSPEDAAKLGREALHYTKWLRARMEGVPVSLRNKLPFQGVTGREAYQRNLRGEPTVMYGDLIPKGYREVTGVGNVLERAWKTHEVTDELFDLHTRALTEETERALPGETTRRRTGRYDTIVVPEKLAKVIEGMRAEDLTGYRAIMNVASRRFMRGWKSLKLFQPLSIVGYNLRNVSGDAEAMFVGNRAAFKKVPQAMRDLTNVLYRNQSPSDELRGFMEQGGLESIYASAEDIGRGKSLDRFEKHFSQKGEAVTVKAWNTYWKHAQLSNQWRESIMRYADYLDTLEHIQKKGTLRNYGASVPEEILTLQDPRAQAYKHANDLLGAFDEVSVFGQTLRQGIVPFWSWKEVNARRWYQISKNAWDDPHTAGFVGRRLLGYGGARALAVGRFALKAAALSALLDSYNRFTDLEGELSLDPQVRQSPHLLLGRGPDGQVRYIGRLGALADLTSYFGVDNPHGFAGEWLNGRTIGELVTQVQGGKKTAPRAAADFLLGPRASIPHAISDALQSNVKDALQMVAPPLQALSKITGLTIDAGKIAAAPPPDRWQLLFNELGAGPLYRWLTPAAAPVRPGWGARTLGVGLIGYHEGAYTETRGWVGDYLRRFADAPARAYGQENPRTTALYQAAKARRMGDVEAVNYNLAEYFANGGKMKDLGEAIRKLSPLGRMPVKEKGGYRREFLGRLTDQEWEQVQRGYDAYARAWAPDLKMDFKTKAVAPEDLANVRYAWTVTADGLVLKSAREDLNDVVKFQSENAPRLAKEKAAKRVGERTGYVEGISPPELRE